MRAGSVTVMRTRWSLLLCFTVLLGLVGLAYAASPIRIVVNGVYLGPAVQAQVVEGQVMVPLRAVAAALGADVRWEPGESCVYITTKSGAEAVQEASAEPGQKAALIVYVTKAGKKYHRADCRYVSEEALEISLEDAKAKGYEPCSVCIPPS